MVNVLITTTTAEEAGEVLTYVLLLKFMLMPVLEQVSIKAGILYINEN